MLCQCFCYVQNVTSLSKLGRRKAHRFWERGSPKPHEWGRLNVAAQLCQAGGVFSLSQRRVEGKVVLERREELPLEDV